MLRYKLRTLLILLAILPPLLWIGWTKYAALRAERERQKALRAIPDGFVVELIWTDDLAALPVPPGEQLPVTVPEESRE